MERHIETRAGEITLLGLVAAIAEAWKWFLIIPIVAALTVYLILGQLVSEYRSTAVLRIDDSAALLTSPMVLRATIQELDIRNELGSTMDDSIRMLSRRISHHTIAPKMTQVSLIGKNAERTQAALATIIKNFALHLTPRGQEREEIERQIAAKRAAAEQMRQYAQKQTRDGQASEVVTPGSGYEGTSFVALVNEIQTQEDEMVSLQLSLEGLRKDDILQEPTLPEQPKSRNNLAFSLLAAIAAGFCLLFVVILGEVVRRVRNDPSAQSDLKRIRNALSLSQRR